MNFCKHTLCFDKSASINYCLFDPSPTLSISSSSKLSWKSSLDYFQTRWFYHTNFRWENNPAPPYEPILLADDEAHYSGFSITFKVYVDGECQIETVYKEFSIKALRPGDHSAYVEAIVSLNDGSRVINTFKSNTVIFSIKEASIDYQTPEAVDLGLSVKWASFNLGASKPEEYGNYYAWGETAPKNIYDWSTYKWCNGSSSSIMKYVDENEGSILYREDDAASKNLGGSWQMPSYEHFHELVNTDNCALQWTTRNGIEGYKVTSKKNGNSIFLPAGGLMMGADISSFNDHNSGYYAAEYWSSSWSTYSPAGAITLHFDMSSNHLDSGARSYGRLIRPVYPND